MLFNFKFSVIMAVHNSKNTLKEAIESVIAQDMGFEDNIQLIIVNDGSTDNSLEIATEFQNRFPENILILNQPHKGLAHARNLGLKHVEGKYVSFLDSDDYFSKNTLHDVYLFFEKHHFETDVVSIPIYYVGNEDGEDELNNKGVTSGIVNLEKDPNNPQLSISSSFFKTILLKEYSFDPNLIYSEGSAILNKIILRKGRYGYLNSVKYYYRKDSSNLSKQVIFNKKYYADRLKHFHLELIKYSLSKKFSVPKFIQYTVLYDLLDILRQSEINIFDTAEEKDEFFKILKEILYYIDSDVIYDNKFINDSLLESFIFYLKNGADYEFEDGNVCLKFGEHVADNLAKSNICIDELRISDDYLELIGFYNSLFDMDHISITAAKEKNGKRTHYHGNYIKNNVRVHKRFLSKDFVFSNYFSIKIPSEDLVQSKISLRVNYHKNGNKDEFGENIVYSYLSIFFTSKSEFCENPIQKTSDFIIEHDNKDLLFSKNFKFSVIMAVYNAEDYLNEAIDSIINQTIGFEKNIQLILVDDGSIDLSRYILEKYKSEYPENILIIYQENQGQAAARNNGLEYASGDYVNFLDSDDYLSENAMEEVIKFYEMHHSEVDVVAIPLIQFGETTARRYLDYKFDETKVIDLNENPNYSQLYMPSTFIKRDSINNNRFPTTIRGSEDANLVNNILLIKQKLGVIKNAAYYYRKRQTFTSDTREYDQLLDEIGNIKKENENLINITQSALEELKSLQKENKKLEKKIKQNDKILKSYNEHFRLIFCYSEFEAKGLLKNMQDICQEMLNFVVNVCEKYNLQYWLDVGTLLGAIRHDGFIPWDDDIDLGMMRKDYEVFKEVFNTELKRCGLEKLVKMKLVRHGNNVLYFVQLFYAGFDMLDIFPYDYIENPSENIEQLYLDERKSFRLKIKEGMDYEEALNEVMDNLNLSYEPKKYIITSVERPGKGRFKIHETTEVFPLTKTTFNNKEYSILKDYDSHLTQTYGDWRKLPKIVEGHGRINKLEKRPNINEHLEKYIKLLKEKNDKF